MRIDFKQTPISVIIMLFLIPVLLGGCEKPPPESVERPNLLVSTEGDVRLKRAGWVDYVPIGFGTLLQYDDLLEVDGTASVLCGDLTVAFIDGRDSCPCPPAPGRLVYRRAYFRDIPGNETPYILHPRNTLVSSPQPLLRWHATGVTSYTISLVSGGETIWSQPDVTDTSIRYPDAAPLLRAGTDYLLVVRDNATGESSQDDPAKGVGFRVLSEMEQEVVEAEREALLALESLDEPARHLALAIYYATYPPSAEESKRRLWGEAWLLLELVAQEQGSPAVHLWIGDVLAAMKLPTEAQAAYQVAREGSEALGDLESQAEAHAGLWRVTGHEKEFEQAVALYQQLGAQDAVEELADEWKQ